MSRIDLFLIGLALANLHAFVRFWQDKRAAKAGHRRTPEATLLTAALFGGFGAWLGQHLLRHKTRKEPFRTELGLVILIHLAAVAGIVWWLLSGWMPSDLQALQSPTNSR
ncbi:DUF1294 domain-containing protein [Brevundimonas sp. NIBR11]|uniref:DUF1294 domain-containing protein n=1 Tax=Brevundimonas sp. NIBR11 TaxID=3015999 RepID=UPI0022F10753|nr:DUF1294 domain-containing protein [Brevundimonas sp. NIBR11]